VTRIPVVPFALALLALGACSTSKPAVETARTGPDLSEARQPAPEPTARPVMYAPARPLQCVPYARTASGISIRGDAWTWWHQADGRYPRGQRPREGSVMLLNTGYKRGHLAYVRDVRGPREIVVDHANWLNRGRIHENTPVRDVSRANDWSKVRVWYVPGNHLGGSAYEVVGFIYPHQRTARR
jgi:surface antigen